MSRQEGGRDARRRQRTDRARPMGKGKHRYIRMYTPREHEQAAEQLPEIIRQIVRDSAEIMEPTLSERKRVYSLIRAWIAEHDRVVYGGTALDEAVGAIRPEDRFYDDYNRSDIEFYSPEPVRDAIALADALYQAQLPEVHTKSAQHPGSFNIIVNYVIYCDITYMPNNVYHRVPTLKIDGLRYAHPHFLYLDVLRIFVQPLTAADFRWEKTFQRGYLLTKYYPLRYRVPVDPHLPSNQTSRECVEWLLTDYLSGDNPHHMMLTGIHAYNWYLGQAVAHPTIQKADPEGVQALEAARIPVYQAEFLAEHYGEAVQSTLAALTTRVDDAAKLRVTEYHPFFQFTLQSAVISYDEVPICRIYSSEGMCIPIQPDQGRWPYVAYQYLLLYLLVHAFRARMDREEALETMYSGAASVLVTARNLWSAVLRLPPHNDTVFSEYVVSCLGQAISFRREHHLRIREMYKKGRHQFRYEPASFHRKTEEEKAKLDPSRFQFPNISGNAVQSRRQGYLQFGPPVPGDDYEDDLSSYDGSSYESDWSEEL